MKADELMRALRSNAEVNTHAAAMIMAADCIEEQQEQAATWKALYSAVLKDKELLYQKWKKAQLELVETRSQVDTVQRERDAAVADLTLTNTRKVNVPCEVCKHRVEVCAPVDLQDMCHNWQWRGVQEGEGGSRQ